MSKTPKQKPDFTLYNEMMENLRLAKLREKEERREYRRKHPWYQKSVRLIAIFFAISLILLFALKFYSSLQPQYVTYQNTKGMPEAAVVGIDDYSSYEGIMVVFLERLRNENPAQLKKLRLSNMGKFRGLEIKESESMYWPLLENAHIESLKILGTHIEPEAWKWLQTIENFDNDLNIQLTNQKLDDFFYAGLSGLLEGKNMDGITIATSPKQIDFCRLIFPVSFNGIRLSLEKYPLPDDTYIIINNPEGGLSYLDKKSGRNITKEVRFGTLPWLLWDERKEDYDLTEHGQDQWRKLHCTKKEK